MPIAERQQFSIHRADFNRPAFPPRTSETGPREDLDAFIYAGSRTDPDTIGANVEEIRSLTTAGKLLLVVPDPAATYLERRGNKVLRPEEVLRCVDVGRVQQDFGVMLPKDEIRSGGSLFAAILFQRLLSSHESTSPNYDLLIQDKQGLRGFPLQWMEWIARKHKPLMIQEKQRHAANEGILYASTTLPRYGDVGKEWADVLLRGWLGSSLVMVEPDVLFKSPHATNIRAYDHILAISAAEQARDQNRALFQMNKAYPYNNVTASPHDPRLMVTLNVFTALTEVLASQGKRLSEATPADYREVNAILAQAAQSLEFDSIGSVVPPVDILVSDGYILEDDATRLVRKEIGKIHVSLWPDDQTSVRAKTAKRPTLQELAVTTGLTPRSTPGRLKSLLEEIYGRINYLQSSGDAQTFWGGQVGARPIYSLIRDEQLKSLYQELGEFMVFNQPKDEAGVPHPYDINATDMEPVRSKIEQELRKANVRVVVPFAGEEESIGGVLNYCAGMVGKDKVIAVDAGRSAESTQIAQTSRVNLVDEKETLGKIDVNKLKEDGLLPPSFELRGSKSLTLLAGMVELERQYQKGRINDETMIVFHDSDIINPKEYNALAYLWLAMVFKPEGFSPRAIHMAKTGRGRNNGPLFTAISDYMNSGDPQIRNLGFSLANLIWPLSGERALRWKELRKCLWTNGMGIETILDLQFGTMDSETGEKGLWQVANRIPKRENRPSLPFREMGMIMTLQRIAEVLKTSMKGALRMLTKWDIHDIAAYNRSYGGAAFQMGFGDAESDEARPNYVQTGIVDIVLPSIELLIKHGYLKL